MPRCLLAYLLTCWYRDYSLACDHMTVCQVTLFNITNTIICLFIVMDDFLQCLCF